MTTRIEWGEDERNTFARRWPCCDVPPTGWAEFDAAGDLVDVCEETRECERGGGCVEFLATLQAVEVQAGRAPVGWQEHPAVRGALEAMEPEFRSAPVLI